MQYKLCPIIRNHTEVKAINRHNDDGSISSIPVNPDNKDYQAYLAWLAEGNEPLPAEVTE
jgi:hypothetical protein